MPRAMASRNDRESKAPKAADEAAKTSVAKEKARLPANRRETFGRIAFGAGCFRHPCGDHPRYRQEVKDVHDLGVRCGDDRRRRKYFSRNPAARTRHRSRHRRLHGHAGDGDQWTGVARCAGKSRMPYAPAERDRNASSGRALHPPARHAPPGKGPRGDFRGGHGESLFFNRHGGGACARWKSRRM